MMNLGGEVGKMRLEARTLMNLTGDFLRGRNTRYILHR
jgi:hypothetical protein